MGMKGLGVAIYEYYFIWNFLVSFEHLTSGLFTFPKIFGMDLGFDTTILVRHAAMMEVGSTVVFI